MISLFGEFILFYFILVCLYELINMLYDRGRDRWYDLTRSRRRRSRRWLSRLLIQCRADGDCCLISEA